MNRFNIVQNGYSVQEVNKFIDDVIKQTEDILAKMKKQQSEIDILKRENDSYKKIENDLKSALYKAEESGSEIRKEAFKDRDSIIDDAKKNASRIINDALLRAESIEMKADTLERNMRIFKRKLKLIVEQQMSVVDEIEELELK